MNKNLNVLHLFNHYLPNTEIWAYNLIENLPNTNVHIGAKAYLYNNFYNNDFTFIHNPLSGINQPDKFKTHPALGYIQTGILNKISNLYSGNFKRRILSHIKENNIDLVHAHFADVGCYYMELFYKNKIPFVTSFYGWDYDRLPYIQPKYVRLYEQLFKTADGIICEGKNGKNLLVAKGCEARKIHVNRLGIKPASAKGIERVKNNNQLKLVQIASFTEKKGHKYTVAAFINALKSAPDMTLCLAGDYEEKNIRQDIINQTTRLGLKDKITIRKGIPYEDIPNFLKDYDVFIHPSCYTDERDCEGGAPIVLLDAQATGMPILSTLHCDIPEEVVHNETGILVPEKSNEALKEAILRFYEMSNEEYQVFAHNAKAYVTEHFDITKNAVCLKETYETLLL